MKKLDFSKIGKRAAGLAVGTALSGFLNKTLEKTNAQGQPMINQEMRGLIMVGAGAFLPGLISKKQDDMIEAVGAGIMSKGVDTLLRRFVPSMVSGIDGTDEGVFGAYDSPESLGEVNGVYGTDDGVFGSDEGVFGAEEPSSINVM